MFQKNESEPCVTSCSTAYNQVFKKLSSNDTVDVYTCTIENAENLGKIN